MVALNVVLLWMYRSYLGVVTNCSHLPQCQSHTQPRLTQDPSIADLPLPAWIIKLDFEFQKECWDKLMQLKHGNVLPQAGSLPRSKGQNAVFHVLGLLFPIA